MTKAGNTELPDRQTGWDYGIETSSRKVRDGRNGRGKGGRFQGTIIKPHSPIGKLEDWNSESHTLRVRDALGVMRV